MCKRIFVCMRLQDSEIRPFLDGGVQRKMHTEIIARGLGGDVSGMSLDRFLFHVLARADDALRARGHGEEMYLRPLHRRLREKTNPGQRAAAVFKEHGMKVCAHCDDCVCIMGAETTCVWLV